MSISTKRIYTDCLDGALSQSDGILPITVSGFAKNIRDKGSIIFIELRDIAGAVQLVFDENTEKSVFEMAGTIRKESVLTITGILRKRELVAQKQDVMNGTLEIFVTKLVIHASPEETKLPFEIKDVINVNDELRLKYRFLDLRRECVRNNIIFRGKIAQIAREYFLAQRFIEIETPCLIKTTPEGARDYLVPSRIHQGSYYALPQSPQIYKQLLMIAGFDRYIQFAKCFRDEDLRADRQPEFTQIDLEMSFVDEEDVIEIVEDFIKTLMKKLLDIDIPKIPRLTYDEAMTRFGSDKPDLRFGSEIIDVTAKAKTVKLEPFKKAEFIGAIAFPSDRLSRKTIDKFSEHVKGLGAKSLAYIHKKTCSFAMSISSLPETVADVVGEFRELFWDEGIAAEEQVEKTMFFLAGTKKKVLPMLGSLRNFIAKTLNIIPEGQYKYVWITKFPFFEYNAETGNYDAMHHPFTKPEIPSGSGLEYLDRDKGEVYAKAYDLVINGTELCSGSIRITQPDLQQKMFELLGLEEEEIQAKFGFLVDAYKFGSPPHGGAGIGLDRLAMTLGAASGLKVESLRDVVAFPKLKDASEPMSGAPGMAEEAQLRELGIIK